MPQLKPVPALRPLQGPGSARGSGEVLPPRPASPAPSRPRPEVSVPPAPAQAWEAQRVVWCAATRGHSGACSGGTNKRAGTCGRQAKAHLLSIRGLAPPPSSACMHATWAKQLTASEGAIGADAARKRVFVSRTAVDVGARCQPVPAASSGHGCGHRVIGQLGRAGAHLAAPAHGRTALPLVDAAGAGAGCGEGGQGGPACDLGEKEARQAS